MNKFWFAWNACMCALTRGLHEGMVMIQRQDYMFAGVEQGVRGHFAMAYYHLIGALPYLFYAISVILLWQDRKKINWLWVLGVLVLVWQCTELGENIARYGELIITHEHINFIDAISINLDGGIVYLAHAVRVIIGVGCLCLALLTERKVS